MDHRPVPKWQFGSALDLPHRLWLTSGRAAIALALQHAGLVVGDEVLVPAYACQSMIEPARFLGLRPGYYALNENLQVTIEEFERRRTPATRAALVARFHGFPGASPGLYEYCREHRIVVIEDRAHAFFGAVEASTDYVIYSATKFFPVFEGGLLASANRPIERMKTTMAPAAFQLKAALWPFEYASAFDAPLPHNAMAASALRIKGWLKPAMTAHQGANGPGARRIGPAAADGGAGLEPDWITKSISWSSRRSILGSNLDWIAARRRHNWERLVRNLSNVSGLHMIHPHLDEDVVPYAAAFTVANPEATASELRAAGVPLYRWDSFALETTDETLRGTVELSHRILQVPTHQAMTDADIDRMSEVVARVAEPGWADRR